jgi:hypothetical protein
MEARATQHAPDEPLRRRERAAATDPHAATRPAPSAARRPAAAPSSAGFDRDAAQRVLRRAVELAERDLVSDRPDVVSETALVEAAEELGMDARVIRRAAAEERLGVLSDGGRRLDRVAGTAVVSATRVVDLPASQVLVAADQWLRRSGLRRRRLDHAGLSADFVRRGDPVAATQRAVRSVSGREHLGRIRQLRVVAQPVDEHRSVVALVADLSAERAGVVVGGSALAGLGTIGSAALELTDGRDVWPLLGIPASVAAGYGVVRLRSRTVPGVELALQGVLDRVADPDPVPHRLTEVRDRVLGGLDRVRRGTESLRR